MTNNEKREKLLGLLSETGKSVITRAEVKRLCNKHNLSIPHWFFNDTHNKDEARGYYKIPQTLKSPNMAPVHMVAQVIPMTHKSPSIASVVTELETRNLVPEKYKNYVPFGNFEDIKQLITSNKFFPFFVTGHSGNGKTMSVEQACAQAGRKFVLVSMTPETDEGDLLGNYILIDGQMVWRDGPVTIAARQGAVLCIDEIDYGAQNLSCLQRVLEGKPFLLKKKNELVTPAPGFTVIATANTKGKGSEDGRYMFTNVLNEAFLERFFVTFEQDWPPMATEKKIIKKELVSEGSEDDEFADNLVIWADAIRKTFNDGGCDEVISTRRLVHIVKTFSIFKDRIKSIDFCLNRFDEDTKASFVDLYSKVDAGVDIANTVSVVVETAQDLPF